MHAASAYWSTHRLRESISCILNLASVGRSSTSLISLSLSLPLCLSLSDPGPASFYLHCGYTPKIWIGRRAMQASIRSMHADAADPTQTEARARNPPCMHGHCSSVRVPPGRAAAPPSCTYARACVRLPRHEGAVLELVAACARIEGRQASIATRPRRLVVLCTHCTSTRGPCRPGRCMIGCVIDTPVGLSSSIV